MLLIEIQVYLLNQDQEMNLIIMHLENHKKWQSFYKNKKHNLEKKWKREKEKMNNRSLEKINMLTI